MKTFTATALLATAGIFTLSGCATSGNLTPQYVPPSTYQSYDCQALAFGHAFYSYQLPFLSPFAISFTEQIYHTFFHFVKQNFHFVFLHNLHSFFQLVLGQWFDLKYRLQLYSVLHCCICLSYMPFLITPNT